VNINSIVSFDSQHLLIATEGYGLLLFDKVKKRFTSWIHEPENSSSLSSNIVNVILKDHQDIIWLGTWGGGVDKLTKQNNSFVLINDFSEKGTPASSGSVFSIVKDKD